MDRGVSGGSKLAGRSFLKRDMSPPLDLLKHLQDDFKPIDTESRPIRRK
jgi:hypothetical protein